MGERQDAEDCKQLWQISRTRSTWSDQGRILAPQSTLWASVCEARSGDWRATITKEALRERHTLVFLDESGLSQRPHRAHLSSPLPHSGPHLQLQRTSLSAIIGLTLRNVYFRPHAGSIKGAQVIAFLQALHRQIPGKILRLWHGAPIHRSKLVAANQALKRICRRKRRPKLPASFFARRSVLSHLSLL
jgi:hypothetical protein